jgi:2-polyprenyl-3-methyl-5-hydroxy-6-metoxy-1,4-benzoquinol methylase
MCRGVGVERFRVGDRNRGLGPECFDYRRCERCGTTFIAATPPDLGRYYASAGYGRPADVSSQELGYERAKLALVQQHIARGNLIEIGPGAGTFARMAARAEFDVTVIERDPAYVEGLPADVTGVLSEDPAAALEQLAGPADVIAMWHVIEHLQDPSRVLDSCAERLRPGGVLAISSPNPGALQFRLLGRRWMHVDAPRHLQLIPLRVLVGALSERGLTMVTMTTTDPVGKALNLMAWERAMRSERSRRPNRVTTLAAAALTLAMKPIEARGLNGAGYTAIFAKRASGVGPSSL